MNTWTITNLDLKPHSPEILASTDEARAIALMIPAGESFDDHQVHESAWLTVIDGQVEISCAGANAVVQWAVVTLVSRHRRALLRVAFLVGALGAGYLWAAAFSDALPRINPGIGNTASRFRAENAALFGAALLWVAAGVLSAVAGENGWRWAFVTAVAGGCLFAVSRIFV